MIYLGIDPGKKGALALIHEDGMAESFFFSEAQTIDICNRLRYNNEVECWMELVHAMPGQGVVSMFNFGMNFGFLLGCLQSNGIEPHLVSPQRWKKEFGLGHDKKDSIQVCMELFPDVNLRRTPKCRTDSDGMAEALLIAEYGRRQSERLHGGDHPKRR